MITIVKPDQYAYRNLKNELEYWERLEIRKEIESLILINKILLGIQEMLNALKKYKPGLSSQPFLKPQMIISRNFKLLLKEIDDEKALADEVERIMLTRHDPLDKDQKKLVSLLRNIKSQVQNHVNNWTNLRIFPSGKDKPNFGSRNVSVSLKVERVNLIRHVRYPLEFAYELTKGLERLTHAPILGFFS
ncbi:MAG: hypothetical protein ABIC04_06295 [Nanoarchaeota archaeon]